RLARGGPELHLRLLATLRAHRRVQRAAPAVGAHRSATAAGAALPRGAAVPAARRLVLEALLGVEALLAGCEHELLAAVTARQHLVHEAHGPCVSFDVRGTEERRARSRRDLTSLDRAKFPVRRLGCVKADEPEWLAERRVMTRGRGTEVPRSKTGCWVGGTIARGPGPVNSKNTRPGARRAR